MAIFYVSHNHGDDTNNGTSWATAVKTIGKASTLTAPGDEVRIEKSDDPVSTGVLATFTNNGETGTYIDGTIVLATPLTKDVDMCDEGWLLANGSAVTYHKSIQKEGTACVQQAKGTGTGKLCYKTLDTDTGIDFSSYEQLCFWFRSNVVTAADEFKICLCSDTTGDVIVDEFFLIGIPLKDKWQPFTVNKGSALGSNIKSVALYAVTATATKTVFLDSIFAAGAHSANSTITLHTLIGKGNTDNDGWFHPVTVRGNTILLGSDMSSAVSVHLGYFGKTETKTLYKLNPILLDATIKLSSAGTEGNLVTYKGGYKYNESPDIQDSLGTYYCGLYCNLPFLSEFYLNRNNYQKFEDLNISYFNYFGKSGGNIVGIMAKHIYINAYNATGCLYFTSSNNRLFQNLYVNIVNYKNNRNCFNNQDGASSGMFFSNLYIKNAASNSGKLFYVTCATGNHLMIGTVVEMDNIHNHGEEIVLINRGYLNTIKINNTATMLNSKGIYLGGGVNSFGNYVYCKGLSGSPTNTDVGIYLTGIHNNVIECGSIKNFNKSGLQMLNSDRNVIKIGTIENCGSNSDASHRFGLNFANSKNNIVTVSEIKNLPRSVLQMTGSAELKLKNTKISDLASNNITVEMDKYSKLALLDIDTTLDFNITTTQNTMYQIDMNNILVGNSKLDYSYYTNNDYGIIRTVTDIKQSPDSDFSWKVSPTNATYINEYNPIAAAISKKYVKKGQKLLFRVYAMRDSLDINGGIRVRPNITDGYGVSGLTYTFEDKVTNPINEWQLLEIPYTATSDMLVVLEAFAYGGSAHNIYVDPYLLGKNNNFIEGEIVDIPSTEKVVTI